MKTVQEKDKKLDLFKGDSRTDWKQISAKNVVQAIWNTYGQPYDEDTPKSSILNYKYETKVKHIEADYISSDGLGCKRLDDYNCGSDCHNIDKESDEYNPEEMEKMENIEIIILLETT